MSEAGRPSSYAKRRLLGQADLLNTSRAPIVGRYIKLWRTIFKRSFQRQSMSRTSSTTQLSVGRTVDAACFRSVSIETLSCWPFKSFFNTLSDTVEGRTIVRRRACFRMIGIQVGMVRGGQAVFRRFSHDMLISGKWCQSSIDECKRSGHRSRPRFVLTAGSIPRSPPSERAAAANRPGLARSRSRTRCSSPWRRSGSCR